MGLVFSFLIKSCHHKWN